MGATYTFDVFSSLDGYGSHRGDWGGYWGKQGPELLQHRLSIYSTKQQMIFGPKTYKSFVRLLPTNEGDPWVTKMLNMPAVVISNKLQGPLEWPNARLVRSDAVEVVKRLKQESDMPMRSHGSLILNSALMAAGLVDYVQVTIFPVITGKTGQEPIFKDASDFDLELIESRTLDDNIQEIIYRPTLHL